MQRMHIVLGPVGVVMADILTIRRLPEPVQAALRERARQAGRSMEAEARQILTDACVGRLQDAWLTGLRARARARTGGRAQTDSALLIAEGRDAR
jgi:hypothetical protein